MNKNDNIKCRIYELRRKKGYSQEYMANSMNISLNSYRKIEKGNTNLISPRLSEIANILEVSCDELILDPEQLLPESPLGQKERQELTEKIEDLKKYIAHLEQLIDLQTEKLDSYSRKDK